MFGELDDLEIEPVPTVTPRGLVRQRFPARCLLSRGGVAPEHFGFAVVQMRDDAPVVRERRVGRTDRLHVAVGHRRCQVALLPCHSRAIAQRRRLRERSLGLTVSGTTDPVRTRSRYQRLSFPAQSHQPVADQSVDRGVHSRHCAAPVRQNRARHLTRADRRVWCTTRKQGQGRGPRIAHSDHVGPARHAVKPRKHMSPCRRGRSTACGCADKHELSTSSGDGETRWEQTHVGRPSRRQ